MLLLYILIFILLHILISLFSKKKNFPNGPRRFPLVGSLFSMGFNLKVAFNKWRKKYGPIVGFYLGEQRCVLINDFDMLNEAFKDDRFCGRPKK